MRTIVGSGLVLVAVLNGAGQIQAQDSKTPYPAMAQLNDTEWTVMPK